MKNPLLDVTTYTDREIQTRGDLLDLPPSMELGAIHGRAADESINTSIVNFAKKQVAKVTEQKINVEEANKQYGIKGLVEFDEPQYPSVAQRIQKNKVQQAQRQAILQQDSFDNNVGSVIGMGAVGIGTGLAMDPTVLLAFATPVGVAAGGRLLTSISVPQKMKNFAGAVQAITKTKGIQNAIRLADKATTLKTTFGTGALRTGLAVGAEFAVTEPFAYWNAQENGYDYDVLMNTGFALGLTGAAAGIGGYLFKNAVKADLKSFKGITEFTSSFSKAEVAAKSATPLIGYRVASTLEMVDNAVAKNILSENIYAQLMAKATDDLVTGRPLETDFILAAMRVDQTGRVTKRFYDELISGELDKFLTDSQKQYFLNSRFIDEDLVETTNFKKFITQDLGALDNYAKNADDVTLARQLNLEGATLKKINARISSVAKLQNSVQKELAQVLDNIKLLETQIGVGTAKAKRLAKQNLEKLVTKRDELYKQVNDFDLELQKTQTLQRQVLVDELELYFDQAKLKTVKELDYNDFKNEVLEIANRLKNKKYPSIDKFGTLTEDTKVDIARLFYLMKPEDVYGLSIKDLAKNIDELDTFDAFQKHNFRSQVEEMPYEQAESILKENIADVDTPVARKLDEILSKPEAQKAPELKIEDLDREVEDLKLQVSPESLKDFEAVSKQIDDEVINQEKIFDGLIQCRLKGAL